MRKSVLGVAVAALLLFAASQAVAGPPPALSQAQARASAVKFTRGVVSRLTDSVRWSVGYCTRLSRSKRRCASTVTFKNTGQVCVTLVTVWNTNTDAEGYYYRRVRGGTASCSGSSGGSGGRVYYDTGSGHWISEVSSSGRYVTLEDGSVWEIEPVGRIDTNLWLIVDDITVTDNGSTVGYPYQLINTSEGEVVDARYLGG